MRRRVIAGDEISGFITKRQRKDGVLLEVALNLSPINGSDEHVIGIIISMRDVTEQEKTRRQLEQSENRYRLIAEHMTDLICVMDAKSMVTYASPSYEWVLGVHPDDYIGQPGSVVIHPGDKEKVKESYLTAVREKTPVRVEYRKHQQHIQATIFMLKHYLLQFFMRMAF